LNASPAWLTAGADGPPAAWRALPPGWVAWWLDRADPCGSGAGRRPDAADPPCSLLSRRLRRRASGRPAAWPCAGADPRWAGLIGLPAPTLAAACRLLAGVWLGAAGPDWRYWTATRRRWSLALSSTAPFHATCPELRARLAVEPELAAAWAWHELRPRMQLGCPGLWERACGAWPEGEPPGLPGLSAAGVDPGPLPAVTPADTARVLRLWRACLQALSDDEAAARGPAWVPGQVAALSSHV
jgi:hypothetical protein